MQHTRERANSTGRGCSRRAAAGEIDHERSSRRRPRSANAPGPTRNYGFVVDNVNVSVFEYEPVRSASVAFTR